MERVRRRARTCAGGLTRGTGPASAREGGLPVATGLDRSPPGAAARGALVARTRVASLAMKVVLDPKLAGELSDVAVLIRRQKRDPDALAAGSAGAADPVHV